MQKIQFEDYPGTTTPVSADNLNQVQTNVENEFIQTQSDIEDITPTNEYSNSIEKSYTCNYVNKINDNLSGKILWENEEPTNTFLSQTITLDETLDNYDMYEIVFRQSATNVRMMNTGKIPVGSGTILSYVTSSNYFRPTGTTVSGNTITFEDAQMSTNGTSVTQNNTIIPMYVIGYKTGLFDNV